MFPNSLRFAEQQRITIADRDYGLMRVTAASGTPHPRVITGVNLTTLKERLEEVQEKSNQAESELEIDHAVVKPYKKIRLAETPHPTRGRNLNPKKIITHLTRSPNSSGWSQKSQKDIHSMVIHPHRHGSVRYSTGPKKLPIIKKVKEIREETGNKFNKKKVTLITPKMEAANYILRGMVDKCSSSSNSSTSSSYGNNQFMSFNERRRIFHEGEFTIAKNGKKMSDNIMPIPGKPIKLDDYIDSNAERAKAEIDLYIRNQGFLTAPTGTLTNLRRFSSQSKRSMPSKRASTPTSQSSLDNKKSYTYFKTPV